MRNIRTIIILAITVALMATEARAQQVPLFNQYYYSGSLAYPSSTVFQENRYVSFVYRDQFGGLVGSPKNFAEPDKTDYQSVHSWGFRYSV